MRLSLPLLISHITASWKKSSSWLQIMKTNKGMVWEQRGSKGFLKGKNKKQKVFYIELFGFCPFLPWGQAPLLTFYLWLKVVVGELRLYLGLCSWWSGVPYWLEWCWGLVWGQAALLRLPEGSDVSIRSKIHGGRKTKLTLKSRHALVCTIYDSNKCRNANLHGKVVREAPV